MSNQKATIQIPIATDFEAMEAMRIAHAESMLAHGSASTAMNAALRALIKYYTQRTKRGDDLPGIGTKPKPAVTPRRKK